MRGVFAVLAVNIPLTKRRARVRKTINRPTIKTCHLLFLEMDKYSTEERRRVGRKLYLFNLVENAWRGEKSKLFASASEKEGSLTGYNNKIMILDHRKENLNFRSSVYWKDQLVMLKCPRLCNLCIKSGLEGLLWFCASYWASLLSQLQKTSSWNSFKGHTRTWDKS